MLDVPLAVFADLATVLDAFGPLTAEDDLDDWMVSAIVAGMALPVGVVALKLGFDRHRRSWLVEDTPTARVRSIAAGRTELKGVARPFDRTYPQPFRAGECVYGRWRVQEYVEEDEHDDENEEKTWETVASGTLGEHVVLDDDTGAIVLEHPAVSFSSAAKTSTTRSASERGFLGRLLGREPAIPAFEDFLRAEGISLTSEHKRRYDQWVIEEGTELYALGEAAPRGAGEGETFVDGADADVLDRLADAYAGFRKDLVLERDEGSGEYVVTDRSEGQIARRNRLLTVGFLLAGIVFVVIGAAFTWIALRQYGLL